MRCYFAMGLRERALRRYSICKQALEHALDAAPAEATETLLREILAHDPR
jgi:DNA-binding SARP family transcriptional activator